MSRAVSSKDLTPGSWTARWGSWVISVRTERQDRWHVRIWSLALGACVQIVKRAILATASDAVSWACDVLRQQGAVVFVDGRTHGLERFLAFSPETGARLCA